MLIALPTLIFDLHYTYDDNVLGVENFVKDYLIDFDIPQFHFGSILICFDYFIVLLVLSHDNVLGVQIVTINHVPIWYRFFFISFTVTYSGTKSTQIEWQATRGVESF